MDSSFTRSLYRTLRQIWEHHKGKGNRDWLQKMGELVGEGEWINKIVLSASLGPVWSIKWVDVDRVSPFSPCSSPCCFFSFCLSLSHPYGRFQFLPSPCPTTHYWNALSPTHKPTVACTSIPRPLSHVFIYGSITANHPPEQMSSSTSFPLPCAQMSFK